MKNFFHNLKVVFHDLDIYIRGGRHLSKKVKISLLIFITIISILYIANYFYLRIYENSYSNITELVNNKEYKLAYDMLVDILKKNPNDPYFLILSARVNIGISEEISNMVVRRSYLGRSLDLLKKVESINPDLLEIYKARGLAYIYLGELALAENAYKKLLTLNNKSSQGWTDLGNLYLMQGNTTLAPRTFTKALEFDPTNEQAEVGVIKVLVMQNESDRVINHAIRLYNKTIDKKIKIQLAEILGNTYSKLTKYNEAKRYFGEGLTLDPKSVPINYGLAEISFYSSFSIKDPSSGAKEAVKSVNNVIKMDPTFPYSYALLTRIAEATNNKTDYDKYLQLTKDRIKDYPFMNQKQKEVFLETLPLFNQSSGNVTIKVLSVKSTKGSIEENNNMLKSNK